MIKFNLKRSALALVAIGGLCSSHNAMAQQCQGEFVDLTVQLGVEQQYRMTDARLNVCQVAKPQLEQLKGFVNALNRNDAGTARHFFSAAHASSDFSKLRTTYSPVYERKGHLLVKNAFQVGDKVLLFFGMDIDSQYLNYFTFKQDGYGWRFASDADQRSGLGYMLAKTAQSGGKKPVANSSITLAQSPDVTLHVNGSRCVNQCADSKEMQLITQLQQLVEAGKFRQLPNHFAKKSAKKLSGWLQPIPAEDKARVLDQHFFPKNVIYHYDFGNVSILGYVKSESELERFNKGLKADVYPQHMYFVKQGNSVKVANFYQETLVDDFLKQQLMLPFLEAK